MRKYFGQATGINQEITDLMRNTVSHSKSLEAGPGSDTVQVYKFKQVG